MAQLTALALVMTPFGASAETYSMWARNSSEAFMPDLIEAFNASHEDQIELQIVPSTEGKVECTSWNFQRLVSKCLPSKLITMLEPATASSI